MDRGHLSTKSAACPFEDDDTQRLNNRRTLEQCGSVKALRKACPTLVPHAKPMGVGTRSKKPETSVGSMQRRAISVPDTEQSPPRPSVTSIVTMIPMHGDHTSSTYSDGSVMHMFTQLGWEYDIVSL
ncbi:hypothetical protein KIPB_010540 [Kipferlia bialata]|uniref:Uncharacterized protein n=1 Tax=Kipferlia bialata TaxID=797122 RepID=A0A391P5Y5_9EUKA|nr:hypothetical protein KIPB_010540 [Kipferlia bialata]|eukprot:g10540.t1